MRAKKKPRDLRGCKLLCFGELLNLLFRAVMKNIKATALLGCEIFSYEKLYVFLVQIIFPLPFLVFKRSFIIPTRKKVSHNYTFLLTVYFHL